jgi:hypothetical protein
MLYATALPLWSRCLEVFVCHALCYSSALMKQLSRSVCMSCFTLQLCPYEAVVSKCLYVMLYATALSLWSSCLEVLCIMLYATAMSVWSSCLEVFVCHVLRYSSVFMKQLSRSVCMSCFVLQLYPYEAVVSSVFTSCFTLQLCPYEAFVSKCLYVMLYATALSLWSSCLEVFVCHVLRYSSVLMKQLSRSVCMSCFTLQLCPYGAVVSKCLYVMLYTTALSVWSSCLEVFVCHVLRYSSVFMKQLFLIKSEWTRLQICKNIWSNLFLSYLVAHWRQTLSTAVISYVRVCHGSACVLCNIQCSAMQLFLNWECTPTHESRKVFSSILFAFI